jgi:hypothetical protein
MKIILRFKFLALHKIRLVTVESKLHVYFFTHSNGSQSCTHALRAATGSAISSFFDHYSVNGCVNVMLLLLILRLNPSLNFKLNPPNSNQHTSKTST